MVMMPDTNPKEGLQNKCCNDNLRFFYHGDGVEWEMYECSVCKNKYVIPIQIQRFYEDAELIINWEEDDDGL
tara:strand:+ start:3096 stop:3311 length:216 start_codon:yes stop_codon:yes gene_type:complete